MTKLISGWLWLSPFFWIWILSYYLIIAWEHLKRTLRHHLASTSRRLRERWRVENSELPKKQFKKLPTHILFILDDSDVRSLVSHNGKSAEGLRALAKLFCWSAAANVSYVSFYDISGVIKSKKCELLSLIHRESLRMSRNATRSSEVVEQRMEETETEKRESPSSPTDESHRLRLLSASDGRWEIVAATRRAALSGQLPEKLDLYLPRDLQSLPDPDLVLQSGATPVAWGCLPWHLRTTEILYTGDSICRLSSEQFLLHLGTYAACEQRWGK